MTKRKAERVLERQKQQELHEHDLDLYLNTKEIEQEILDEAQEEFSKISMSEGDKVLPQMLPGMVLLKNFLSPKEQQEIVRECRDLGIGKGGFYKPTYASGAKCRLHQMCLGKHWNVVTEKYEQVRTNHDSAPVIPLPASFIDLTTKSLAAAFAHDPQVMGACKKMIPDVCVVNFYKKAGRNGMHIDKDESPEAMEMGSPVISFSIGCKAEFAYTDHYPDKHEGVPIVTLESGDVLVFGGPSRKLVHALTRVYANTQPTWLRMRAGRLNLTFREYKPSECEEMEN